MEREQISNKITNKKEKRNKSCCGRDVVTDLERWEHDQQRFIFYGDQSGCR